jgi:hypothetical protein
MTHCISCDVLLGRGQCQSCWQERETPALLSSRRTKRPKTVQDIIAETTSAPANIAPAVAPAPAPALLSSRRILAALKDQGLCRVISKDGYRTLVKWTNAQCKKRRAFRKHEKAQSGLGELEKATVLDTVAGNLARLRALAHADALSLTLLEQIAGRLSRFLRICRAK